MSIETFSIKILFRIDNIYMFLGMSESWYFYFFHSVKFPYSKTSNYRYGTKNVIVTELLDMDL